MEEFVQQRNIETDHWRRTGALMFDGSTRLKEKVTYQWICEQLEATYKRKLSYGTVVQCVYPGTVVEDQPRAIKGLRE